MIHDLTRSLFALAVIGITIPLLMGVIIVLTQPKDNRDG